MQKRTIADNQYDGLGTIDVIELRANEDFIVKLASGKVYRAVVTGDTITLVVVTL